MRSLVNDNINSLSPSRDLSFTELLGCGSEPHSETPELLLKSQPIVHRHCDVLLRTQIPLRRLDGAMAEQELDLFKVPAGFSAKLRTRTAKVMRAKPLGTDGMSSSFYDVPD